MKSPDIRLTDKEKRNQVLLCLDYKVLNVIVQGIFSDDCRYMAFRIKKKSGDTPDFLTICMSLNFFLLFLRSTYICRPRVPDPSARRYAEAPAQSK